MAFHEPHALHSCLPSSSPLFLATNRLLTTVAGSRLYGTSTPTSDVDLKGIYLPSARSLLLGTSPALLSFSPAHAHGVRNMVDDTDATYFSLARFLKILGEGQPDAVELALAGEDAWVEASGVGRRLMGRLRGEEGRGKWVTKEAARRMVGFARHQVKTYRDKARRIEALEEGRRWLEGMVAGEKLGSEVGWEGAKEWVKRVGMEEVVCVEGTGGAWRVEVVGRALLASQTVEMGLETLARALKQYSRRTIEAKENGGADWKGLAHAIRLAHQGKELMETGTIVFPRPPAHAALLREVKAGKHTDSFVTKALEQALAELELAMAKSTVPDKGDEAWLEELVLEFHLAAIQTDYR